MTVENPTWKQIRAFTRLCKKLGLDSRPGADDCFQATAEASHKAKATKEINTWQKAPTNVEPMRDAIARWFAVDEALKSIGVGAEEETGIKAALDYWGWCKNRTELSDAHKAARFAEKGGLPDMPVVFALPTAPVAPVQNQIPASNDRLTEVAAALKAAGFSALEVAEAIRKLN
jgi:hypothetical protein